MGVTAIFNELTIRTIPNIILPIANKIQTNLPVLPPSKAVKAIINQKIGPNIQSINPASILPPFATLLVFSTTKSKTFI